MDEESGVKVPATRLRRRLSVESEGVQSPATPSTPTKKRGTRLAKPALELIDENVSENVPKKTTPKSIRDVVDPVEEKAVTPSRRSARIRSNTSLVLEITQNLVESPRARRAIRRNSQLGSDTETTTPVKPSRRTRKDSTSSIDKLAVTNPNEKVIVPVVEVIVEEPEKEIEKHSKGANNDQSPSPRKSPRLNKKGNKSIVEEKDINDITQKTDKISSSDKATTERASVNNKTDVKLLSNSEKENLSLTSACLINEIGTRSKKSSVLNKTTPTFEEINNVKSNRKTSKSWTTITSNLSTEDGNLNDKNFNKDNYLNASGCGSGDSLSKNNEIKSPKIMNKSDKAPNSSVENKENINFIKSAVILNAGETAKLLESDPSKDMQSVVFMEDSDSNSGSIIGKLVIDLQNDGEAQHNNVEDQCVPVVKQATPKRSTPSESFSVEPMDIDETIPGNVTINDYSDKKNTSREENKMLFESSISNEKSSNMNDILNKSKRTSSISIQQDSNDSKQKTSIGDTEENNEFQSGLNKSDRLLLSDKSQRKRLLSIRIENCDNLNEKANKSKRKSTLSNVESEIDKRKSSVSSLVENDDKINESVNKSKRKSGSGGESQNLEKSSNENKSTLVLSHLKDVSANETNNVSKSPNDTNNEISNIPDKTTDKKNMPLNYLTSTPVQQKSLQKAAMQINTSIISHDAESKNTSKLDKTTPKKTVSHVTDLNSDASDEGSRESSKMIDDEAEEASSDYESGDSRNDEEKLYEKQHEVVDEGETLESEQEFSDDSDYEKDSFVVSSDEGDNDLLSGSSDDLSLSDNELKITTKSKKKFDERKRKEQKKASKEMYEARHQLNESDKSTKSEAKKSKRLRLESEKEDEFQPKGKNRHQIDSSLDVSLNNSDGDGSIRIRHKKTKRLTESFCEENAIPNESEITIFNQSVKKIDPLSVSVKQEPKTPQKELNMSTVLITDNIEEVQVDGNASVMKPNETSDPLQATITHEESDSDISENLEIKENYDSVLESLNKSKNKQKKAKTGETSLNLNTKKKEKVIEPIVDQLNLTQTKKSKKNKAQVVDETKISDEPKPSKKKDVSVVLAENDDGETSDSIDMRLLFPDDSNDSDTNAINLKFNEIQDEPADNVIPLKRTEAMTNIRQSIVEPEDKFVGFFVDTKGTYEDMDTSTQDAKKNKQNVSGNNFQNDMETNETVPEIQVSVTDVTPVNVSLKSDKKKKKKNNSLEASQIIDNTVPEDLQVSLSAKSDKKKKNKSLDVSNTVSETPVNDEDVSDKKNKKKNKSRDAFEISDNSALATQAIDEEVSDKKKKKNRSQDAFEISGITELITQVTDEEVSDKKKKKNKSHDAFEISDITESETPDNDEEAKIDKKKKKKNRSLDAFEISDNTASETPVYDEEVKSDKKKKKKNKLLEVSEIADSSALETPVYVEEVRIDKKKKKNKSLNALEISDYTVSEAQADVVQVKSDKKKKKKNKSLDVSEIVENTAPETPIDVVQVRSDKKKKKNKSRNAPQIVDNTGDDSDDAPMEISYKSEKNNKSDVSDPVEDVTLTDTKNKFKKGKKKKNKNMTQLQTDVNKVNTQQDVVKPKKRKLDSEALSTDAVDDEIKITKNKKKRKISQIDEPSTEGVSKNTSNKKRKSTHDEDQRKSKVLKENSLDMIHVPRLPESIVNQLGDKPPKEKKQKISKAISTVPFEVETGKNRKNKPSNYLEQSIYLNDTPKKQKQKQSIKNPKVLPFVPTVITSDQGYTSNFRINTLPEDTQFVAQSSNIANFKNEYLSNQRIKKLGTLERYKKQRNHKISKF